MFFKNLTLLCKHLIMLFKTFVLKDVIYYVSTCTSAYMFFSTILSLAQKCFKEMCDDVCQNYNYQTVICVFDLSNKLCADMCQQRLFLIAY